MSSIGIESSSESQVLRLAKLAKDQNIDGVVCSAHEAAALRRALGPDFLLVVPGIRPSWAAINDQKRIITPADAIDLGIDYLVIGRPITDAVNPIDATRRIIDELEKHLCL